MEAACLQLDDGTVAERLWAQEDSGQEPGYAIMPYAAAVRFMREVYSTWSVADQNYQDTRIIINVNIPQVRNRDSSSTRLIFRLHCMMRNIRRNREPPRSAFFFTLVDERYFLRRITFLLCVSRNVTSLERHP